MTGQAAAVMQMTHTKFDTSSPFSRIQNDKKVKKFYGTQANITNFHA